MQPSEDFSPTKRPSYPPPRLAAVGGLIVPDDAPQDIASTVGATVLPTIPSVLETCPKFPLIKDTKRPAVTGWQTYDGPVDLANGYGIPTGERSGYDVLDLDVKVATKNGLKSIATWCHDSGDLLATFTVKTPSGGQHLYFLHEDGVANRQGLLPGVDVRGDKGLVVGPGSVIDGKAYEVEHDVPIAKWPPALLELVRGHKTGGDTPSDLRTVSRDDPHWQTLVNEAEHYADTEPPCVSGEGGHNRLLNFTRHLRQVFGLPRGETRRILDLFNARCRPPWSEAELEHKLDETSAYYGRPGLSWGWAAYLEPGSRWWPLRSPANAAENDSQDGADNDTAPDPADLIFPSPRPGLGGPRSIIKVSAKDLHANVKDAGEALHAHPALFQRAGELVRLVRVSEADADRAHVLGTPTIRNVGTATLKAFLTEVAIFETSYQAPMPGSEDGAQVTIKKNVKPDNDIVAAVHAAGEWPGTRVLNGIVETPTMRPDGTIVQTPGYDEATGYLYEPNGVAFPEVPDAPSHEDARRALDELQECFCDFPYAEGGGASAVPIAALLTVIARPAISGNVPMFVFDAPTRGSGKSLQTDVIAMIATGRVCSKATWPGEDDVEAEKILGAYARQAVAIFGFDNVSQDAALGGGPLDKYLTCQNSVAARILGKSEMAQCQWRTVMMASGNNVAFRGDTVRRVLVSRLESNLERPEARTDFRHPDLLDWVRAQRPRLVVAALTILRGYVVAGRPKTPAARLGSFEAWSDLVPAAIVWAGGPDATLALPAPEADDTADTMRTLFAKWPIDKQFTSGELLKAGTPYTTGGPPTFTEGAFGEALEAFFDDHYLTARAATSKLRTIKGRVIAGKKLVEKTVDGTVRWSVARIR